ncbi:MAG TPA: FAD-dependent oxidoreductase, partial [Chryseosolibacter sp.]
MKQASEVDLIIIGQGLAGSAVAMRALARGFKIRVFDQPSENRSSQIAAGLFNPITGRKMVKTWLADALFPSLHLFYRQVERLTRTKFFYPTPIYRPFISIEEQNEWMGKSTDWKYETYISVSLGDVFEGKVKNAFGGLELKQSGYLDTCTYLEAVREYLKERSVFEMNFFDCEKLEIRGDAVRYDNLSARRIVFCQGVQ